MNLQTRQMKKVFDIICKNLWKRLVFDSLSLHEPLLVLQIENDESGKNQLVLEKLANLFGHFSDLESLSAE